MKTLSGRLQNGCLTLMLCGIVLSTCVRGAAESYAHRPLLVETGWVEAQTLFTLTQLGFPHVKIYYGSFSNYSALPYAPVEK